MEENWNWSILFSLQEIAIRRLVVNLWTLPDVLSSIDVYFTVSDDMCGDNTDEWCTTVENKVKDKISTLTLPKSLAKQSLLYVRPVGLEIKRWKAFHECYLEIHNSKNIVNLYAEFNSVILSKLYWTSAGTVDYQKTAEKLIRCELLDIVNRYCLACLYCLEDYIPVLWKQLPKNLRRKFYKQNDPSLIERTRLEYCWPYILKGKQSKLDRIVQKIYRRKLSFNLNAFTISARCGNKAAVKYFYKKLTQNEKESSLIKVAKMALTLGSAEGLSCDEFPWDKFAGVLCFLLSLMNHDQQMKVFRDRPIHVLRCFMDWPWQDNFLKILDFIWTLVPAQDYNKLLQLLRIYFIESKYYFPHVLQKFFKQSPLDFRQASVAREWYIVVFFPEFFNIEDSETVKVIFRSLDVADRAKLVLYEQILELFYNSIWKDRWYMVEVCLQEATLSKENKERLKKAFLGFLKKTDRGNIALRRQNWKQFFQLLDKIVPTDQNKRSLEIETLGKRKKTSA